MSPAERVSFLAWTVAALSFGAVVRSSASPDADSVADRGDRAEIARLALQRALVLQEIPGFQLLGRDIAVVSTENLDAPPASAGVPILPLSPSAIRSRAERRGDFPYLRFESIHFDHANSATVVLRIAWARARQSLALHREGSGFELKYVRQGGKWKGQIERSWLG